MPPRAGARRRREAWLESYRPRTQQLLAAYERAAGSAQSEAEAEIYWDEILERAGL